VLILRKNRPKRPLPQGEYRMVYPLDEKATVVKLALILDRDRDYRELKWPSRIWV